MDDLVVLYNRLSTPTAKLDTQEAFISRPIRGYRRWHVAKSVEALPAVLISPATDRAVHRLLAVQLENLRVEHNVLCSITSSDGQTKILRCSIIHCLSTELAIQECFLRTIGGTLLQFTGEVTADDISSLIDRLLVLFRLVVQPPLRTFRGLWAELFVILSARDAATMIDAWHNDPNEHFDFSDGVERLEVKSSSTRSRAHLFSLEQVYPPTGVSALVASLHVESHPNGTTLGKLWDDLLEVAPSGDARMKIERVCVESLGHSLEAGRAFSGDWNLAMQSLTFYCVTDIPRLRNECPLGVSDVRFRSDLELADPVTAGKLGSFHRCCVGSCPPHRL